MSEEKRVVVTLREYLGYDRGKGKPSYGPSRNLTLRGVSVDEVFEAVKRAFPEE